MRNSSLLLILIDNATFVPLPNHLFISLSFSFLILHRMGCMAHYQARLKQEASVATLRWMRLFPRNHCFSNYLIAREMLKNGPQKNPEAEDIALWLKNMPSTVVFKDTALDGCPAPQGVKIL